MSNLRPARRVSVLQCDTAEILKDNRESLVRDTACTHVTVCVFKDIVKASQGKNSFPSWGSGILTMAQETISQKTVQHPYEPLSALPKCRSSPSVLGRLGEWTFFLKAILNSSWSFFKGLHLRRSVSSRAARTTRRRSVRRRTLRRSRLSRVL